MYSLDVFTRGRQLCNQILPEKGRLHQPVLASKTRDTGLSEDEDRIPLRSVILTQYRSVTGGLTDGYAVAYTALAKLALRRARCKNRNHNNNNNIPVRQLLCDHHTGAVISVGKFLSTRGKSEKRAFCFKDARCSCNVSMPYYFTTVYLPLTAPAD